MEQWEKLWIRGMLPDLLENTKCSAGFLAYLQSANVLSGEEAEKIVRFFLVIIYMYVKSHSQITNQISFYRNPRRITQTG